jgi:hypothetical protein
MFGGGGLGSILSLQRRVRPYHQSQYRLAGRTFERPDVMPFDDWFNRRKRSLYIAGGA